MQYSEMSSDEEDEDERTCSDATPFDPVTSHAYNIQTVFFH